ncbi:hypothetical protein BDW42DRAFT_177336 [Aspergillus taichungensis]|uniref:Uncharacterized protein n=1 Tax=Aspergillus taichungensis TaxID=482145 RepID=A0A2J5HJK7_9EURO|nr:hypothetical protein BDW42DRAFT_177336 [Aspergillus taichungensis]
MSLLVFRRIGLSPICLIQSGGLTIAIIRTLVEPSEYLSTDMVVNNICHSSRATEYQDWIWYVRWAECIPG